MHYLLIKREIKLLNKKYLFIANPIAGRGKTRELLNSFTHLIKKHNIDYEIILTEGRGHLQEILKKHHKDFNRFIAIGGDGTVNELINYDKINELICGILPTGSGNDLANALGMNKKIITDLETLINKEKIQSLDLGKVYIKNSDGSEGNFTFINSLGIGFDAAVAARAQKIKYISGLPLYLLAVFKTLFNYKSTSFTIESDNFSYNNLCFMVAIGNGQTAGGGFKLTPLALLNDGLIDICIVKGVNKFSVIKILPKAITGNHIKDKRVIYLKSKKLNLTVESPLYVHADGEILTSNLESLSIKIIPNYVKFLTP